MHQRSWLAVKPIRKSSPPPATPPMLGRSALLEEKEKIKRMKTVQNKAYMAILAMRIVPHICKTLGFTKKERKRKTLAEKNRTKKIENSFSVSADKKGEFSIGNR